MRWARAPARHGDFQDQGDTCDHILRRLHQVYVNEVDELSVEQRMQLEPGVIHWCARNSEFISEFNSEFFHKRAASNGRFRATLCCVGHYRNS
ncbi:MAG: hypothetical protein DMG62_07620 [Acidobacteria bacterium]|nr:MAG: hypothetical protein DMG62_07620 [Acidobacteriota bacterium]